MRDELRRLDHLTRSQRAKVVETENGDLSIDHDALSWVDPKEPMSLDAALEEAPDSPALIEQVEEPRNDIERFELQDALHRASADLPDRAQFVLMMREISGDLATLAAHLPIRHQTVHATGTTMGGKRRRSGRARGRGP